MYIYLYPGGKRCPAIIQYIPITFIQSIHIILFENLFEIEGTSFTIDYLSCFDDFIVNGFLAIKYFMPFVVANNTKKYRMMRGI